MVKLNVIERLSILQILPTESSFLTLKIIRDLSEKMGLSADEYKEYEVKENDDGSSSWNKKGVERIEFEIKEKEVEVIAEALKKLDEQKKLSQVHFRLYKEFVTE